MDLTPVVTLQLPQSCTEGRIRAIVELGDSGPKLRSGSGSGVERALLNRTEVLLMELELSTVVDLIC